MTARRVVVVVDDEPVVLRAMRELLERAGFPTLGYVSARHVLETDAWRGAAVAVIDVVLDAHLGDPRYRMDGEELWRQMSTVDPEIKVQFVTGLDVRDAPPGTLAKATMGTELVRAVGDLLGNGHAA